MKFLSRSKTLRFASASAGITFCLSHSAMAIIVGGTLGTGNNNAGEVSLQSYLSTTALNPFGYWNNLVRVSDASGIYLGYNASTSKGWVLSAAHISPEPTTISVAGNTYTVNGTGTQVGATDLMLYEIGGNVGDPILPNLTTVSLTSSIATPGEFLLMTGRGFTTSSSAPYAWGTPGFSDAAAMRWGTNNVEGLIVNGGNNYLTTDLDSPLNPLVTAFEGQGSLGDSGGGIFIYRGGQWQLSGIAHFVGSIVAPSNPSEVGDITAYTDINSYISSVNNITGTLVPEPSSVLLLISALPLAFIRRRDGN